MAETSFAVKYDGPALADGRMPVRDLAPALLSLGDLFAEASRTLYPDRPPVALDIKATREGSFDIQLLITVGGLWDQVVELFDSDAANALANLKELVIGSGIGLFALIKRLRGRRIQAREPVAPGKVRLSLDDGETIEVPSDVLALHGNLQVRKTARDVVAPAARTGIDQVEFRSEREVTVSISTDEVLAFDPPGPDEQVLLDEERTMLVAIASVVFTEGNKWRFSDGEITFFAAIEDEQFLDRVDKGIEVFRKGDILRCRARITQSKRNGALHSDYRILEVIEHIPSGEQLLLEGEAESPPIEPPPE